MTATDRLRALLDAATCDRQADRVVPPLAHTVGLTLLTSGAMPFRAVLALALATGHLADHWAEGLAQEVTVRIPASATTNDPEVAAVLAILRETPGVVGARPLGIDRHAALMEPWLGPDVPLDVLCLPA